MPRTRSIPAFHQVTLTLHISIPIYPSCSWVSTSPSTLPVQELRPPRHSSTTEALNQSSSKMGMIQDDKLKAVADLLARRVHELKKIMHRPPVRVLEPINSTL